MLVPANFNAPGQIVVSGSITACERIAKAGEAAGFRTVPLKVAGAFHSPLMQPAADRMAAELEKVQIQLAAEDGLCQRDGEPHADAASIKQLLVDQIVKPLRWEQTMQTLVGSGDARYIELAPGRVLTGLVKKINRRLPIESFASVDAIKAPLFSGVACDVCRKLS